MSCPYCAYDGTDKSYLNENIVDSDGIVASLLYEHEITVWLPSPDDKECLSIQAFIPIKFCPMCGREL